MVLCLLAVTALPAISAAKTVSLNVVGPDGEPIPGGFRWLLEEDGTFHPALGQDEGTDGLGLNFHRSYMPVVGSGDESDAGAIQVPDASKHYFVSVLPKEAGAYGLGAAGIAPPDTSATVTLNTLPTPTAQISCYVFHDNHPLNNAPDLPQESGLAGFAILLEEPAGRYGVAGGPVQYDAFGNLLGTTYDENGNVLQMGTGVIFTDENGLALIKNMPPGKYGVRVSPPIGESYPENPQGWLQTSTIEGSKVIDAWVKANEPPYFTEFGPAGHHVEFGFVRPFNAIPGGGTAAITGQVRSIHYNRPPDYGFNNGAVFPDAWIGLNDMATREAIYAAPTLGESEFTIAAVPPGNYQLVIWDRNLDVVFASMGVTVNEDNSCGPNGGPCDLGPVGVFDWFGRLMGNVFWDTNADGFQDPGEDGLANQQVLLRWRDGTIYGAAGTNSEGFYNLPEVFPFFNWLVAEVALPPTAWFPTGATMVADAGGPVNTEDVAFPGYGRLNPQPQPENNGLPYRTETGEVLTQAFQVFLGQTNVINWGMDVHSYDFQNPTNGGISGMVFYDVTRAEDDPRYNLGEEWQPGIPRVQVNLYPDGDNDMVIDAAPDALTFAEGDILSYGGPQDENPEVSILDGGATVQIVGNGWKKVVVNYDITPDTVLEFDFQSGAMGEIHGIGFDTDDTINNPIQAFNLYGSQTWGDQTYAYTAAPNVQHFVIPVGQTLSGFYDFLTFVHDHDVNNPNAESVFSNIRIYEEGAPLPEGQLADVDNYPFQWAPDFEFLEDGVTPNPEYTGMPGDEDIDYNANDAFDMGAAIQVTWTDSWDDNQPTDCPGDPADPFYYDGRCYDGLRNFNQVRPGVFDGGYAFGGIPNGVYIVEAVPPPHYKIVRSHDRNVDFGEDYTPGELADPPPCVGDEYPVEDTLTLFPGEPSPKAGQLMPDCDRKQIRVSTGKNAAAEFFMFTEVPPAAHVKGFILNDLANEFDPNNPNFGEKFALPNVPVSFKDYTGREIVRVYSDQYGNYNAMLPSTFTTNLASPSGMGPNMMIACMNDPGPIDDPDNPGQSMTDPYFQRQYTTFCYTFQYMPATITYLDTPVEPIAAFAGQNQAPLDCEFPDGTPVIRDVTSAAYNGPYVAQAGNPFQITAMGGTEVTNPAGDPIRITRDFGFGTLKGKVFLDDVELEENDVQWSSGAIEAEVPEDMAPGSYQLTVVRGDNGRSTVMGITLTVGPIAGTVRQVNPSGTIQAAIDGANDGDLILIPAGTYDELVILWKEVQLQGAGAPSVLINAVKAPGEKLQQWRDKVTGLVEGGQVSLLPNQNIVFDPQNNEPGLLDTAEGPGVMVLGKARNSGVPFWGNPNDEIPNARIDGISITGSDIGGGIVVNGYARSLEIANNKVFSNAGLYAGGIRIGHPALGEGPVDSWNRTLEIHDNHIAENGGRQAGAGGIAVFTGANGYRIEDNYICGNFTLGVGGGIGHMGLSPNGQIVDNQILFNQAFNQQPAVECAGGGIGIAGESVAGELTPGSGTVIVDGNRIQGNLAGAGDGGGVYLARVSGQDVAGAPADRSQWHRIDLFNNIVVNNVSGLAGGGIALSDVAYSRFLHNTVAHNDSTATAADAFLGDPNMSEPQPAGIVSRGHSAALADILLNAGENGPEWQDYSRPRLVNNIVYQNRSFYWDTQANVSDINGAPIGGLLPDPDFPDFWDLGVLGGSGEQAPIYSLLTDATGYAATNVTGDPAFLSSYFNGDSSLAIMPENKTPIATAAAVDEGGNFIDVRFWPLSPVGDYHIGEGSAAIDAAVDRTGVSYLAVDYDDETRPGDASDIGADEMPAMAETLAIPRADWFPDDESKVVIRATSTASPGATLTASVLYGNVLLPLGDLRYRADQDDYVKTFKNVNAFGSFVPTAVQVTSTAGGSAEADLTVK
jgi:hypothetical protein